MKVRISNKTRWVEVEATVAMAALVRAGECGRDFISECPAFEEEFLRTSRPVRKGWIGGGFKPADWDDALDSLDGWDVRVAPGV